MSDVLMRSVNAKGANFTSANLRSGNFDSTDFASANMTDAQMRSANVTMANFQDATGITAFQKSSVKGGDKKNNPGNVRMWPPYHCH